MKRFLTISIYACVCAMIVFTQSSCADSEHAIVECGGDNSVAFYDTGGPSGPGGNYQNDETQRWTFCPHQLLDL